MIIKKASFKGSFDSFANCPKDIKPEFAFIGRSNVGKSSLINMLTGNGKLAKVSSTPGKTQTINFFGIDDAWNIVDLPGYGWARTAKEKKSQWDLMVMEYLLYREQLQCLFVLIDSRIPPQQIDLEFIQWAGENNIPMVIVFTKVEKLKAREKGTTIAIFEGQMLKNWAELPDIILSSSVSGEGKKEILGYIGEVITIYKSAKN